MKSRNLFTDYYHLLDESEIWSFWDNISKISENENYQIADRFKMFKKKRITEWDDSAEK